MACPRHPLDVPGKRIYTLGECASIAMTAPLTQESGSKKIEMTAPVTQEADGSRFRFTFTMPAEYTLETLPEPLDGRVLLRAEPPRRAAAVRYRGT